MTREVHRRHDAVGVLLYDVERDAVVLVEQFRAGALEDPASPWKLEVVAGLVEEGESPAEVARREAMEEAGARVETLIPLHAPAPATSGSASSAACWTARDSAACTAWTRSTRISVCMCYRLPGPGNSCRPGDSTMPCV